MSGMKTLTGLFLAFLLGIMTISAKAEEQTAALESIYGLERVSHLALGPEDELLILTLPDRVLIYEMFPMTLVQDVRLDVRGYASALSDAGNLFVLGDDPESAGSRSGSGGSVQVFENVLAIEDFDDPNIPGVFPLANTPFTELLLTEAGDLFVSNPTSLSVLRSSEAEALDYLKQVRANIKDPTMPLGAFSWDNLSLQCDTSSKFSVFTEPQATVYLSSAIGSKLLEIGPVSYNQRENKFADCYSPDPDVLTRSTKNLASLRGTPLEHSLVDTPSFLSRMDEYIMDTGLLSFDPTSSDLTFTPVEYFDGFASFVRTRSRTINLSEQMGEKISENQLGLLASDEDGVTIMVAIIGSRSIHRIRWTGDDFAYSGRFIAPRPIRRLVAGPEGKHFVVAFGGDGAPEDVLIIRNAALIPEFEPLPIERFSVQILQATWNVATLGNLNEDGILGPATRQIVTELTKDGTTSALKEVGSQPLESIIWSLFPTAVYNPEQ